MRNQARLVALSDLKSREGHPQMRIAVWVRGFICFFLQTSQFLVGMMTWFVVFEGEAELASTVLVSPITLFYLCMLHTSFPPWNVAAVGWLPRKWGFIDVVGQRAAACRKPQRPLAFCSSFHICAARAHSLRNAHTRHWEQSASRGNRRAGPAGGLVQEQNRGLGQQLNRNGRTLAFAPRNATHCFVPDESVRNLGQSQLPHCALNDFLPLLLRQQPQFEGCRELQRFLHLEALHSMRKEDHVHMDG